MELEVRGVDEALARLERIKNDMPRSAAEAMRLGAGAVYATSQLQVPRRTGALAASGEISGLVDEGDGSRAIHINYGGGLLSYSRLVHYNNRTVTHRIGNAYFVTDPMRALRPAIGALMQAAAEAASEV